MEKKTCENCKKNKPANQFTKTDTKVICVDCKNKAIDLAKKYYNKPR